jgi:prolyl oligopeptidase
MAHSRAKPKYPPICLPLALDDRVHPPRRKMTAKLQAMGYEAYFYEPAAGGHGYGKVNSERAALPHQHVSQREDRVERESESNPRQSH